MVTLVGQEILTAPSSTYLTRVPERRDNAPGRERESAMESTLNSASAGLFECDFLSKAARDTRRQKFSWVVRALSGPLSA